MGEDVEEAYLWEVLNQINDDNDDKCIFNQDVSSTAKFLGLITEETSEI